MIEERRPRVVVVDDDDAVRGWLVALMRHTGIEVTWEAANAAEGVRAVLATRPDAVLMDLRMSGMEGIEAARDRAGGKAAEMRRGLDARDGEIR